MSISTLNPVQPPLSSYAVGGSRLQRPTQISAADPPAATSSSYLRAIVSGSAKVAADKFLLKESGDLMSSTSLTKGSIQALLSYFAADLTSRLRNMMPAGMGSLSEITMQPLVVGIAYSVISKYFLKKDGKMLKEFLTSALADYASKMVKV